MKAKVFGDNRVAELREDGRALFNCGHWFTTYAIPGETGVYFISGLGYAFRVKKESLSFARAVGGLVEKSKLSGVDFVDGKPYAGEDN